MEVDPVDSEAQAIWNGVRTAGKKVHARARTRFRQSLRKEDKGEVGGGAGRRNQIVTLARSRLMPYRCVSFTFERRRESEPPVFANTVSHLPAAAIWPTPFEDGCPFACQCLWVILPLAR